jgi:hypothetical protein
MQACHTIPFQALFDSALGLRDKMNDDSFVTLGVPTQSMRGDTKQTVESICDSSKRSSKFILSRSVCLRGALRLET